jgi:hypothetical protein|tara:strand:+ start:1018 stop:1428 length:411 start_codon:yes stop_codon:yes gene_type:complete
MKKLLGILVVSLLLSGNANAEKIILDCKLLNLVEKGFNENKEVIERIEIDIANNKFYYNGYKWNLASATDKVIIGTVTNDYGDIFMFLIDRMTGEAISHDEWKDEATLKRIEKGGEDAKQLTTDGKFICDKAKAKF